MVGPRRDGRSTSVGPLVLAAIVTALLVVGVLLLNRLSPDALDAEPGVAPSADNPCADLLAGQQGESPTPVPLTPIGGDLAPDPERLWLCGDDLSVAPAESLTTDVNTAITAFNELPTAPADQVCTQEYRLTYFVVIDYANERNLLRGELHGCRTVSDGEHQWTGGEEWLTTLQQLWSAQRENASPPADDASGTVTECGPVTALIPADPAQLRGAIACADGTPTDLDPTVVERVADALGTATLTDPPAGEQLTNHLVFTDAWGSPVTLTPLSDHGFLISGTQSPTADSDTPAGTYWEPPAELEEQLRALV